MRTRIYHKYTDEERQFIYENVDGCYLKDLVIKFNKKFNTNISEQQLENFKQKNCLKSNVIYKFTSEQKEFIEKNIGNFFTNDLVKEFNKKFNTNITIKQIRNYKSRYKLHSGLIYRGGKPAHVSIGTQYLTTSGTPMIKISNNKRNPKLQWMTRARYIYKKHNGKIPNNYVILHLDGNKSNDTIDNLMAIPKSYFDYLRVRGLIFKDKETNKTVIMSTDLLFKAIKKKKEVI